MRSGSKSRKLAVGIVTAAATIIGTWYGMNFKHMPELQSAYGYRVCLGITLVLTALMWVWCKRRKWI